MRTGMLLGGKNAAEVAQQLRDVGPTLRMAGVG